ncbi:MAG: hypothetical protein AABY22_31030 [Nanoarchaeota archaeon]
MNKGDVIYINNPHPSHSWSNGLYVIKKVYIRLKQIDISLINKDGSIQDSTSRTGTNENPNIFKTKLKVI